MTGKVIKYRNWEFEVNLELTKRTYANILVSGADTCACSDCKNYVAYRDKVFPEEILNLFTALGIDYRKEVEITIWEARPKGLYHIGGWFHFSGKILSGKNCRVPNDVGEGYTLELTNIYDNFSIGFTEGNDLTYFNEKAGLIQIEFATDIPWIVNSSLEGPQK